MPALKQSDTPNSAQKLYRAAASEMTVENLSNDSIKAIDSVPGMAIQRKPVVQKKPGEDEELPVQREFLNTGVNTPLQAFQPIQEKEQTFDTKTASSTSNKVPFIQAKLAINAPGDQYEQEADAMADKVMRMPANGLPFSPSSSAIQRRCSDCEDDEKVHRKETSSQPVEAVNDVSSYVSSLSSKGSPMPGGAKSFFESRFGRDFSDVKIHDDGVAAKSAQSINALAYTNGNNIVFNQNQFSPETDSGKRLLAHELTHVVQQNKTHGEILRKDKKPPSTTLFIGMNDIADDEAKAVHGGDQVIKALNKSEKERDTIVGKDLKKYHLNIDEDLTTVLKTISIPDTKIPGLIQIFQSTPSGVKVQMFKIVDTLNQAENNKFLLERIVLSGHSLGGDIFGDKYKFIDFSQLQKLKVIFPDAFLEIRHLMVSACSTGGAANLSGDFKYIFPELNTIWAYPHNSPSGEGSIGAIGRWDKQTSNVETEKITPDKDATGWSKSQGLINVTRIDLGRQLKIIADSEPVFLAHFNGDAPAEDSHRGTLFNYYTELQNLVGNTVPLIDAVQAAKWKERIEVVVRLRYYRSVKKEFVNDYLARFSKGYKKLKLNVPAYQILSRKDALTEIEQFVKNAKGNTDSEVIDSLNLLLDFKNLNNPTTHRT